MARMSTTPTVRSIISGTARRICPQIYPQRVDALSLIGSRSGPKILLPLEFRLRTTADVLDLLEEQVDAVVKDADSTALEKARCIGFLCGVTLRAIEAGDLAARLEALEAVLKARKNGEAKS